MASDAASPTAVARPRVHVRGAVKSFSGRVVVDVDDLVLGEHPIEGLIGPNGAGQDHPDAHGHALAARSTAARSRCARRRSRDRPLLPVRRTTWRITAS